MPAVSNTPPAPPTELPALAGAPSAGNQPADFLQLMARLIGATPAPDADALLEAASSDSKVDTAADRSDDSDGDEALSGDIMAILGLGVPPVTLTNTTLPATDTKSSAINISQGAADALVAPASVSPAGEHAPTADDTSPDLDTFTTALQESAAKTSDSASGPATVAASLTASLANLGKALAADSDTPAATSAEPSSSVQPASMQAAGATQAHPNVDAATQPRDLRAPVGTHAWRDELGDHLTMLAQRGHDSASLRLSPEHLGPLEVRISMREGEATVWFGAANADTRSALDQSLPRLREMFASQGMVLVDAGVFRDAPREQPKSTAPDNGLPNGDEIGGVAPVTQATVKHLRLIDTYA